jgi:hypothetical protein
MSTSMTTQPVTSPAGPAAPPFADVYRMDIDDFERVADLLKAERVELIDGFIVERGAMDPPHVLSSPIWRAGLGSRSITRRHLHNEGPRRFTSIPMASSRSSIIRW